MAQLIPSVARLVPKISRRTLLVASTTSGEASRSLVRLSKSCSPAISTGVVVGDSLAVDLYGSVRLEGDESVFLGSGPLPYIALE